MTDLQSLYLALVILYLLECVIWLPRGTLGFLLTFGNRWVIVQPSTFLGSPRGGWAFAYPFPPLGMIARGQPWPVSISPRAVYSWVAQCLGSSSRSQQRGRYLAFDRIRKAEFSSKRVLVNGETFVDVGSSAFAGELARLIARMQRLPEEEREAGLESALAQRSNPSAVRARLREHEKASRLLRASCNVLFAYLFILAPAVIRSWGLPAAGAFVLGGFVLVWGTTIVAFYRAHRRLYPQDASERWVHLVEMVLLPPAAVRANDALSRHLLVDFDPFAIASVLFPSREFAAFARRAYRDVLSPIEPACPADETGPREAEAWFRARLRGCMEAVLEGAGIVPADLRAPPERTDENARAYCPRCDGEYVAADVGCDACGGLPLQPFEPREEA